jgi:hypothetical protein
LCLVCRALGKRATKKVGSVSRTKKSGVSKLSVSRTNGKLIQYIVKIWLDYRVSLFLSLSKWRCLGHCWNKETRMGADSIRSHNPNPRGRTSEHRSGMLGLVRSCCVASRARSFKIYASSQSRAELGLQLNPEQLSHR